MAATKAFPKIIVAKRAVPKRKSTARSGYRALTVRKVHVAAPSSATEIRETLGVSKADLRAALYSLKD
jgi:2-hydroxychromene-2-carboxylate isomerase